MEKLTWRHVGVLQTLLTGACGYDELYQVLKKSKNLRDVFFGSTKGEPNLIWLIRDILRSREKNQEDVCGEILSDTGEWNEKWMYDIKFRRMGDAASVYSKELLLTYDSLIIPWPLPFYDKEWAKNIVELARKQGIKDAEFTRLIVEAEDFNSIEFDSAQHLCLSSLYTVLDLILIDETSDENKSMDNNLQENRQRVRTYEVKMLEEDERDWVVFVLSESLDLFPIRDQPSTSNVLSKYIVEKESRWKWEFGMCYRSDNSGYDKIRDRFRCEKRKKRGQESSCGEPALSDMGKEKANPDAMLYEVHPCSAFGREIRDYTKLPKWQRKMCDLLGGCRK